MWMEEFTVTMRKQYNGERYSYSSRYSYSAQCERRFTNLLESIWNPWSKGTSRDPVYTTSMVYL